MQGSQYDLDEIIAEIKGQQGQTTPPDDTRTDGEAPPPHPESAALNDDAVLSEDTGSAENADKSDDAAPAENTRTYDDDSKAGIVMTDGKYAKALDELFADDSAKRSPADKKDKAKKSKTEKKKPKVKKTRSSASADAAADENSDGDMAADKKPAPPKHKKARTFKSAKKAKGEKKSAKVSDPDEIEHQTDEDSERRFPYDFVNRTYQDTAEALHTIGARLPAMGIKLLLLFPVWLISLYMTLAFPLKLPMPFGFSYFSMPFLYLLVYLILEIAAVMLASDVTVSGLARLVKGKPTLDTLVLFASVSSMAYILTVILFPKWGGWLPYTPATVGLCFFSLSAKRRRFVSLRRTYKILHSDTSPTALKAQGTRKFTVVHMTYKSVFPEMSDISSPDYTERFSMYYTPLAILISIALATAASFGRQNPTAFPWCLSALSVMTVSPALLISSVLPNSTIGKKLFESGSTFVNSKAFQELSRCRSAVFTDNEVFPAGSIAITSLKIGDGFELDEVFSTTSSALEVIGGGLYSVFDETSRKHYGHNMYVDEIRFFESGGMSAKVNDNYVLIGTANFLMRMGVDVLSGVKLQNCLYVSINSRFAGVFSLKYIAQPQVFSSFRMLRRAKVTPLLALRDFLTTEAFIEDKFKLHANTCDYPDTQDRVDYSSDNFEPADPLAVMSHSNMYAYAELLLSAKKLTRRIRFNVICSVLGSIVGLLIMYFLTSNMEVSSASPLNILVYMGCWALPVWLSSLIFTII